MTFLSFISAFCATLSLVIGSMVLRENIRSPQNRLFALFCFLVAFISFAEFDYRQSESLHTALFWFKIGVVSPLLVPLMLHFIAYFTHIHNRKASRIIIPATYITAVIFILVDFFSGQISGVPARSPWGWDHNPVNGFWYTFHLLWTIALYLYSMALVIHYFLKIRISTEKVRAGFTMFSFVIIGVFTLTTEKAFPYLGFEFPELSTLGYVIANSLIAYAMWKFKMFSISPITAAEKIVETMSDGMFLIDNHGTIVSANNAAYRLCSSKPDSLQNIPFSTLFGNPKDYNIITMLTDHWTKPIADHSVTIKPQHTTEATPVSLSLSPLTDRHGDTAGAVIIARNITERINAQKALQDANENLERKVLERTEELAASNLELSRERDRLDVTLRSIGDGVIVTSTDGSIELINKTAEEILGCTFDEVRGKNIHDVFKVVRNENHDTTLDPVGDALRLGSRVELEDNALLITRDGSLKRVDDSAAPIIDSTNATIGCVLVFRDSTEKIALQQELFKVKRLESVSAIAGAIACDFGSILTRITNNMLIIKLLEHHTEDTVKIINETEQMALDAQKLTGRLSTFSGTNISTDHNVESVEDLIKNSIGFILKNKTIDYELYFDEHLMNVIIDRNSFNTMLTNLVINAEEAISENGMIEIEARNVYITDHSHAIYKTIKTHELSPGDYIKITIRDNGHGISDNIKELAFDPFFSTKGTNRGMGLSVVYSIVKKLGGIVFFEPEITNGCEISILLPSTEQSTAAQLTASVKEIISDEYELPESRILFINHTPDTKNSIAIALNDLGFPVNEICDLAESFQAFNLQLERNQPFDFLIFDTLRSMDLSIADILIKFKTLHPSLKTIVLAHPLSEIHTTNPIQNIFDFTISKPLHVNEIAKIIYQTSYC
jgi:PAS domain S-box-containing protein